MKQFIFILTFLFSLTAFSQSSLTPEIKISKNKISTLKSVKEIVSEIPADCLINSFECTANSKDGIATVTNNSDDFNDITKNVLSTLKVNNKFYISHFKSSCDAKLKKEYCFIITE